jgi:PEGA domain
MQRARIAMASVLALTAQAAFAHHSSSHHSSSHHSSHHASSHHSHSHGSCHHGATPSHAVPRSGSAPAGATHLHTVSFAATPSFHTAFFIGHSFPAFAFSAFRYSAPPLVPGGELIEPTWPIGGASGALRLSIQPEDAAVYVDSELQGVAGTLEPLELAEGEHRIEIVRPGFQTIERTVTIRAGEATDLRATLEPD